MNRREQLQEELDRIQIAARAIIDAANGAPTGPEKEKLQDLLTKGKALKARIVKEDSDVAMTAEIERLTGRLQLDAAWPAARGSSLGAQFVASETFQWLQKNRGKLPSGQWNSPASELAPLNMMATTLDESSGSGGPIVIPQYQPGIVPLPQRPLRVADLMGAGTADSNAIVYMREKTFTNAAAATAEGTSKPESTLVFESITELVRKVATFLPVSEELLEDVAAMKSYLDQRLSLGVDLALDDELLNGSGVAPHLTGFLNRAGLTATQARGADNNADCVLKQIGNIQAATFVRPDGIVMHPTNWQTILLSKDANGRYYGDSPFSMVGALSLWGQPVAPTPTPTLWGLPVALTPNIAVNTCLVGCFKTQSMLFRRGGLRVESTNSHASFFQTNLIAVRAELRAAAACYRPLAFGLCSGLT
jgi:HK97 family phage major capsid protein